MPRQGLTPAALVEAALELVDEGGPDALTLTAVAARTGVRVPSLYNHVDGVEDLRSRTAARALDDLADALDRAADDTDPRALLHAYRRWARAHPARHALLPVQPAPAGAPRDSPTVAASVRVVEVVTGWAGRFDLHGNDAVHAARALRSAVHGFCSLETAGGYGLPVDVDESFRFLVDLLVAGLSAAAAPPDAPGS